MRRSFQREQYVVPARAGVILKYRSKPYRNSCCSRASGGDPTALENAKKAQQLFPRERG